MRRFTPLCLVPCLVACTSSEPERPAPEREEAQTEEPAPVEPEASEVRVPDLDLPWNWFHHAPDRIAGGVFGVGFGQVSYARVVGDARRYVVRSPDGRVEIRREKLVDSGSDEVEGTAWTVPLEGATVGSPVVLSGLPGEHVAVGSRTAEGYRLHLLDSAGTLAWSRETRDPVTDGAEAAIQLQVGYDREGAHSVRVFNRGTVGGYVDAVDLESGELVGRRQFDATTMFDAFEWPADGVRARGIGHRWSGREGSYALHRKKDAIDLEALGPDGKPRWESNLVAQHGRWRESFALIETEDAVTVAFYSGASSGAAVVIFDRATGTRRHSGSPGGIGMIGHSRYSNRVALSTTEEGLVLTHGDESGGQYMSVLDPHEGVLLGWEVWR